MTDRTGQRATHSSSSSSAWHASRSALQAKDIADGTLKFNSDADLEQRQVGVRAYNIMCECARVCLCVLLCPSSLPRPHLKRKSRKWLEVSFFLHVIRHKWFHGVPLCAVRNARPARLHFSFATLAKQICSIQPLYPVRLDSNHKGGFLLVGNSPSSVS